MRYTIIKIVFSVFVLSSVTGCMQNGSSDKTDSNVAVASSNNIEEAVSFTVVSTSKIIDHKYERSTLTVVKENRSGCYYVEDKSWNYESGEISSGLSFVQMKDQSGNPICD